METNDNVAVAAQMQRRARRMRWANAVMRPILNLPFRTPLSNQLMLLFYTGRRSGRAYRQPVSYVVDGDVLLTPGGGRWKSNLREGEPITARIRGQKRRISPKLVRDADEVERLLRLMMERNRRLTSFVPFINSDGEIDRRGLERALAHGFCVVRWRAADGPRTTAQP
jgi:hypothetical protein